MHLHPPPEGGELRGGGRGNIGRGENWGILSHKDGVHPAVKQWREIHLLTMPSGHCSWVRIALPCPWRRAARGQSPRPALPCREEAKNAAFGLLDKISVAVVTGHECTLVKSRSNRLTTRSTRPGCFLSVDSCSSLCLFHPKKTNLQPKLKEPTCFQGLSSRP